MNNRKFRILSIDGGGIRGIIPATILANWEAEMRTKNPEFKIKDCFDLVCGTSTGGIIALGVSLGIDAKEILDVYLNHGSEIFPWYRRWTKYLRMFFGQPFYSRNRLEKLLELKFSDKRLNDCKTKVCIPVYDARLGQVHVFKTAHCQQFTNDLHIPAVKVALATAAAPAYFSAYRFTYTTMDGIQKSYGNLIDGGMLANNPTLIGLTEAISRLKVPIEDIEILSLGTGKADYNHSKDLTSPLRWACGTSLYDLMSSAQSIYINNTVNCLTDNFQNSSNPKCKHVRIEEDLSRYHNIALDEATTKNLTLLKEIGENLYQNNQIKIKEFYRN